MAKGTGDEFEILGYFIGFWLFLFNKSFRTAWIEEFKNENTLLKLFSTFEAIISILFGVGIPGAIIFYVFTN